MVAPACSCLICSSRAASLDALLAFFLALFPRPAGTLRNLGLTLWVDGDLDRRLVHLHSGLLPEVTELGHGKPETGGVVRVKLLLGAHLKTFRQNFLSARRMKLTPGVSLLRSSSSTKKSNVPPE